MQCWPDDKDPRDDAEMPFWVQVLLVTLGVTMALVFAWHFFAGMVR